MQGTLNEMGNVFERQGESCWLKADRETGFTVLDFGRSFSHGFVKLCVAGHALAEANATAANEPLLTGTEDFGTDVKLMVQPSVELAEAPALCCSGGLVMSFRGPPGEKKEPSDQRRHLAQYEGEGAKAAMLREACGDVVRHGR